MNRKLTKRLAKTKNEPAIPCPAGTGSPKKPTKVLTPEQREEIDRIVATRWKLLFDLSNRQIRHNEDAEDLMMDALLAVMTTIQPPTLALGSDTTQLK